MTPFAADIRRAAALLREVESESRTTRDRCRRHADRLDRAAAHLETLEIAMRNVNELISLVVADVNKLRADAATKDARIADLESQLAAAQANAVTPENVAALDALEPETAAAGEQGTPA
jgi:septal ring factor EnvC (AmiA/AmiB activator)